MYDSLHTKKFILQEEKEIQKVNRRFFFVAQSLTASETGNSLTVGPSIAIRSSESKVFSFILFLSLVLISFSWENVRSMSAV